MTGDEQRQVMWARGNDAMNKLIDVYMNGVCSGVASAALTLGMPIERADAFADTTCDAIRADPLAIEAIRREVLETLTGTDSGPSTFTLPTDGGTT